MAYIEKSIEVGCPVGTVYDQWTQFEEFPRFMEGVEEVVQHGDRTLHWKAKIAGTFEGRVPGPDGEPIALARLPGVVEDHWAVW